MADDIAFMQLALAEAEQGLAANEMPIGALTVLDGEVVSATHWRYQPDRQLDHADIVALREAERDSRAHGRRRRDMTLYVTMEPCLMCMGAAMSFRLGRIVFALEAAVDGASDINKVWEPPLGHPPLGFEVYTVPEVVGGVCRDEALALMRTYVARNPDLDWAKAMLPGFSYPTTGS